MLFHQTHNSASNHFHCSPYREIDMRGANFREHFHRNYEFIRVTEGNVALTVNSLRETLYPGDCAIILPNQVHAFQPSKDCALWLCIFSSDYVAVFDKSIRGKLGSGIRFQLSPEVDRLVTGYLERYSAEELSADRFRLTGVLYLLVGEFASKVSLNARTGYAEMLMDRIQEYIIQNYQKEISLSTLARAIGYDYYYLSHVFSSLYGMTFSSYLNLFRVEQALSDLTETDLPITDIALKNGFSSIRTFNYVFRKISGTTPSDFRKNKQ